MGRKKADREESLLKKRVAERLRREKIKKDPTLAKLQAEKQAKWNKMKKEKQKQMTNRQQRELRKKWRKKAKEAMNELDVNLEIQKRKRKKGVLNKSEYKAEIIKKARVSGSSYISWTGKEVPEITPGEDCKCRRKCFTKVADEERKRIFETFRSLGSKNEQDNYLQSLIAATEVKQKRRRKSSEISRKPDRGNTFIYEVSTPSGKQQ
ncbi:hypothetical protein J6590_107630, partial [Homalodisca vitripennis]